MAFKHLSSEERHYIEIELKNGTSQNKIAEKLGRSQSSLSRELGRNKGLRGYRHQQAHRMAQQRHQEKNKAVKLTEDIKRRVSNDIRSDWSPEQVAGRLEKEGVIKLHHETIYQFIEDDKRNGGTLYKHLRHQKNLNSSHKCITHDFSCIYPG